MAAALLATLAFAALAVQPMLGDGTYLANLGAMLRFFTIWGNCAAALVMAAIALGRPVARSIMAALVTALSVIALVYWTLLAADHHPTGWDRITNQFHHTIVPAATILWWLIWTPRAHSILAQVPVIMIPPLSYGAFALVLGEATGFYAYFFLDLPRLGWLQILINMTGLAAFFAGLGMALLALKRMVNRLV